MLLIDAVLVVAMVCVSGYGGLRLPPDARVPVHFGPWSERTSVPKTPGLVMWAAVGVVTWLAAWVPSHAPAAGAAARAGLTVALATVLTAHTVAVGLAMARSRSA